MEKEFTPFLRQQHKNGQQIKIRHEKKKQKYLNDCLYGPVTVRIGTNVRQSGVKKETDVVVFLAVPLLLCGTDAMQKAGI